MQNLFAYLDIWTLHLPVTVALAAIATIGYLVGRWSRQATNELVNYSERELLQALAVATELENISMDIHKCLGKHHANITRFKDRIGKLNGQHEGSAWQELCREAEEMLKSTLKLTTHISNAYDEIRQQSCKLMNFTETRTDPLTNVKNRRALDETLQMQFALLSRYRTPFSLVILDIDHFKCINDKHGHLCGDRVLIDLARLLNQCMRETDILTRYGGDEFVVIMSQTDLDDACIFSDRLRTQIQEKLSVTVSGGVASAKKGDTQEILLTRADTALYQAKIFGRNCIFRHEGNHIAQVSAEEVQNAW